VNWIAEAIGYLVDHDCAAIEATPGGRRQLGRRMRARPCRGDNCSRKRIPWYLGANVPGKPRGGVFMLFVGGFRDLQRDLRRDPPTPATKGFDLIKAVR